MSLVLEKKLKKVLDLRTDSPAMIDALDSIAPFWGDNTLEARRNLRSELEERNVELANRFLEAFEPFREQLEKLDASVGELEGSCSAVMTRLSDTEGRMRAFSGEADELQRKRAELEARSTEVADFLARFQLTPDEADALRAASLDDADGGGDHEDPDASNGAHEDVLGEKGHDAAGAYAPHE